MSLRILPLLTSLWHWNGHHSTRLQLQKRAKAPELIYKALLEKGRATNNRDQGFSCETGDSKDIMKRPVVGQVVSMSTFDSISKHTIQQGKRLHPIPHTPNPTHKTRLKDNISSPKTKLIRKETPVSSMYMAPTQLSYPSSLQDPLRETCHDEPCLHSNRFQNRSHGLEGWRL